VDCAWGKSGEVERIVAWRNGGDARIEGKLNHSKATASPGSLMGLISFKKKGGISGRGSLGLILVGGGLSNIEPN